MSKYEIGGIQGRFQAGSNDQVLENKLGITDPAERDEAELVLLGKLYEDVLLHDLPNGQVKVADLKKWHYRWLGNLYEWAGEERSVNMSKGDFHFAVATQIPQLLEKLEREYLQRYTHCIGYDDKQIAEAVAIVHVELILIHPFRDGNGRLSRLLADVMMAQAGYPPLDYTSWDKNKPEYFLAIRQGMDMNYAPMKQWVARAMGND